MKVSNSCKLRCETRGRGQTDGGEFGRNFPCQAIITGEPAFSLKLLSKSRPGIVRSRNFVGSLAESIGDSPCATPNRGQLGTARARAARPVNIRFIKAVAAFLRPVSITRALIKCSQYEIASNSLVTTFLRFSSADDRRANETHLAVLKTSRPPFS